MSEGQAGRDADVITGGRPPRRAYRAIVGALLVLAVAAATATYIWHRHQTSVRATHALDAALRQVVGSAFYVRPDTCAGVPQPPRGELLTVDLDLENNGARPLEIGTISYRSPGLTLVRVLVSDVTIGSICGVPPPQLPRFTLRGGESVRVSLALVASACPPTAAHAFDLDVRIAGADTGFRRRWQFVRGFDARGRTDSLEQEIAAACRNPGGYR